MSGIDVLEISITAENTKKHGGVFAHFGVLAQKVVDVIENSHRIGAHGHTGKCALQHGREQSRAKTFAGDVRDQKCSSIIAHRKHIKVVSSDGEAGEINPADREMGVIAEAAWQKGLLNLAGDAELLLKALALALVLNQSRIVQNAGGFDGKCIENLALEF